MSGPWTIARAELDHPAGGRGRGHPLLAAAHHEPRADPRDRAGEPAGGGAWLTGGLGRITLALHLIPFAGIAFLWFIGVLRDRFGQQEDKFFATVFFGSGLLFLAMLFSSAAVAGGVLRTYGAAPGHWRTPACTRSAGR